MHDFIDENNSCGHNLLCLVSRGNAIVAEILRLKEFVPSCYRLSNKNDQLKYGELLLDFSIFKQLEEFEKKLDANPVLRDLDEELRDNNIEIVTRFYLLFESIYKYVLDLNRFIQDLEEGLYIQQTFETIFVSEEGKQLMCETLYLCGVMLLLVDLHIDGLVRERLLVSYFRYSAQRASSDCYVDDVCQLLRSSGFSKASPKRPADYPEAYFKRTNINEVYIKMVVGRLRTDDIYHQLSLYPLPEHRSTALASQAAMLFVALFFEPAILHSQQAAMREIVDKYFPDCWIISIYMGEVVNLASAWENFKAAKTAMANTLESSNVEAVATKAGKQLQKLLPSVMKLNGDKLGEQQLLDNSRKVLNLVREANVTLRWLLLHTTDPLPAAIHSHPQSSAKLRKTVVESRENKKLRMQVSAATKHDPLDLFHLLLHTAEFELHVRETIKKLLIEKPEKWKKDKQECIDRLLELAEAFSGVKPLNRLEKNDKLQLWFKDIAKQIESLDYEQVNVTGRKIVQLIQALEEVQEFHGLSTHGQARQVLGETRDLLHGLLRSAGLLEENSIQLQVIADMSYAWLLLGQYADFMKEGIKADTSLVVKLRATFLKMAIALEIPLLRINQARSPDLISVSQYYSSELVAFLRRVLHIIPKTMFEIMANIANLQTESIKEIPTRLDKEEVREYAQLDRRFQVAKLTHDVSNLTEGVTMLKSTLVGVIQIDPIELLEDGIRCELVGHIANDLEKGLSEFKGNDLELKLERLGEVMEGKKRSFEYIQDYIQIYGLKIWQEELTRVIGYYVEQECNNFLRNKVSEAQSLYQSKAIPIPNFSTGEANYSNCIGRLVKEIIRITDPRSFVYLEPSMTWYESKDKEVLGLRFFGKVARAVGIPGLAGVDRLISFMIASQLRNLVTELQRGGFREADAQQLLGEVSKQLASPNLIVNASKVYSQLINKTSKLWSPLLEPILKVGQMQLLRVHIAYQLSTSCQFESPHLSSALETFNRALLSDVTKHYKDQTQPHPDEELLYNLSAQLDGVGQADSLRKIYVTTRNIRHFPVITTLFALANLPKLLFVSNPGAVPAKRTSDRLDGPCFTVGLHTLLWQCHSEIRTQFLSYVGHYVKSKVADPNRNKADTTDELQTIAFLETLIRFTKQPRSTLSSYIPLALLDIYPTTHT